jgi:hypothetical protein
VTFALAWVGVLIALAVDVPKYEAFTVSDIFQGKPVAPVLKSARDKQYRTVIRTEAAKGPNFAGRFTIAEWGCGTECVDAAMVDSATGVVVALPFNYVTWQPGRFDDGAAWPSDAFLPLSYRKDSRLFVVHGCDGETLAKCGAFYYDWTGSQFKLFKKFEFRGPKP